MADEDIVVFLDAQGNEVSNDPRWLAKQQIMKFEDTVSEPDVLVTQQGVEAPALADRDAKWLKEEVKRRREAGREIDTTGVKTKGALVAVLEADDEAQEQEELDSLNADDENTDDSDADSSDDDNNE